MDNIKYRQRKSFTKLLNDIKNIKKLIKIEKRKEKLILSYTNKNFWRKRKYSDSLKISHILDNLKYIKDYKNIINNSKERKLSTKNLKLVSPFKDKISFRSLNKTNDKINDSNITINRKKSTFNLITEVNKNNKKSYSKKPSHFDKNIQVKNVNIPGSEKIIKDVKNYMEKYKDKFNNQILEDSNIDILKKIEEAKKQIKKKDILLMHKNYFSFSKKNQNKINLLEQLDKKIYNLDKDLIKQTTIKSFEN